MVFIALAFVAAIAGAIDSISGGGGLIAIPSLLWVGLSPAEALATNKLQAVFGKLSAVRYYHCKGLIDWRSIRFPFVCALMGGAIGSITIQIFDDSTLHFILPWLIGAAAIYILFSPAVGDIDSGQRVGMITFSVFIVVPLSFYDGFFGPASGSLFTLAFAALLGKSIVSAVAHGKLLLLAANSSALAFFVAGGEVQWGIGFAMAIGQWVGAQIGSALVRRNGVKLVRPMTLAMCCIVVTTLIWDSYI